MSDKVSYSLKELCRSLDVTERTVRYYISEGLLPPPTGNSPFSSRYGYEHWLRLHFIRRLKEKYLPLSEIKNLLAGHSVVELESLARRTGLLGGAASETENVLQDRRDAQLESLLRPGPTEMLRKQATQTEADTDAAVANLAEANFVEEDETTITGQILPSFSFNPEQGFETPAAPSPWQPIVPPSAPMSSFGSAAPNPAPPPPPGMMPPTSLRAMGGMPPSSPKPAGFSAGQFSQNLGGTTRFSMSTPPPSFNQSPPGSQPPPQEEAVSQNWERIVIAPGIELHVESSIANKNRSALSLLLREIRRLLKG